MEPGRGGRGEPAVIRAGNATPARTKRKKARPTTQSTPDSGPIPQPYLALAPKPLSSLSRSYLQTPTSSNLVLPSSFRRPATAGAGATSSGDAGPSTSRTRERERERFANGLLAPPAIRAGGSSTPITTRRDRPVSPGNANTGVTGGRRRTDRVRGMGPGNPSVTSLGHLGRIMESDPPATIDERTGNNGSLTPAAGNRRRRRIVRGDDGPGISRRLTVSSREEGRAMGLARGASMRRLNVWDDVPENDEAPPPFPFPTSSSSRLPPTFEANPTPAPIPNSPPPTFEQATSTAPTLSLPPPEVTISSTSTETVTDQPARSSSRASTHTHYESAPSSPVLTALDADSGDDFGTEQERSDRRMWNADLLAGYSLEERVRRETNRKTARESVPLAMLPQDQGAAIGEAEAEENTVAEAGSPVETVQGEPLPSPSQDFERPREPEDIVEDIVNPSTTSHSAVPPMSAAAPAADPSITEIVPTELETAEVELPVTPEREEEAEQSIPSTNATAPSVPAADVATPPVVPRDEQGGDDSTSLRSKDLPDDEGKETGGEITPTPGANPKEADDRTESVVQHPEPPSSPVETSSQTAVKAEVEEAVIPSPPATITASSASLPTLAEAEETEPIPAALSTDAASSSDPTPTATSGSDTVLSNAGPSRKLTRGKAIRRSSSGLIKTSDSPIAAAPLFSASRFDFGTSSGSPTSSLDPDALPRPFIHRSSAPEVHTLAETRAEPKLGESGTYSYGHTWTTKRRERKSEDKGLNLPGGRRLGDPPPPPPSLDTGRVSTDLVLQEKKKDKEAEKIPPHREAALLRRESILANLSRPAIPTTIRPTLQANSGLSSSRDKRASLPSGPLIDFSDFDPERLSEQSHGSEITGLAATNAELLELLEHEATLPQSSSQAASAAALVEDLRAQLQSESQRAESGALDTGGEVTPNGNGNTRTPPSLPSRPPLPPKNGDQIHRAVQAREGSPAASIIQKKAPPPPPPLRSRPGKEWTAGQKISIVDTATSPITPRPSIRRPPPSSPTPSPTRGEIKRIPPPIPTRRPPPPPPRSSMTGTSISVTSDESGVSSIYDKTSTIGPLPREREPTSGPGPGQGAKWHAFARSPNKPRGPRPRPPPPPPRPRTWARIVSGQTAQGQQMKRPGTERTQSEEVLSLAIPDAGNGAGVEAGSANGQMDIRSPTRSASEQNLSAAGGTITGPSAANGAAGRRRIPEYTDLDVFVSRLEGSGREYEGYSHIAQFLGPAKSPAASREALSSLLPGPITIESRRTTKEGKVKLKLTLLGVRVTKCPICLAQFREGEMGVLLPICGHLGHEACAGRWFREDDRCFVCRERLKAGEGVV